MQKLVSQGISLNAITGAQHHSQNIIATNRSLTLHASIPDVEERLIEACRDASAFRAIADQFGDFSTKISHPIPQRLFGTLHYCDKNATEYDGDIMDFVVKVLELEDDPVSIAALRYWRDPTAKKIVAKDAPKVAVECAKSIIESARKLEKSQPMFKVLSHRERRNRPRAEWLVDELLKVGSTSWLTAKSGDYKSFVAIDLALCVATGKPFHGRDVKRGNVVYVAAEGESGLCDREDAWAIRHQTEIPELPFYGVIEQPADISDARVMSGFIDSIRELNPAFIVLDTQSRCTVGRDLNSTSEATIFFSAVTAVAKGLGAHVLVLAHNNKNGEYAGNHQGPAMVDTHLTLRKEKKAAALRCVKQKDGTEEAAAIDFVSCAVEIGRQDEKGREITSLVLEASAEPVKVELSKPEKLEKADKSQQTRAAMLAILKDDFPKGARATEWKAKCEQLKICKPSTFYVRVKELHELGQIRHSLNSYIAFTPQTPITPIHSVLE